MTSPSTLPAEKPALNDEQSAALDSIIAWLADDFEPFYVLSGSAGTGKTFCIRELVNRTRGRFIFTAPTNKATKVLRESVTTKDYKPECRTIYSLLGLRLEANGEVRELTAPEDPVDLSEFKCVIVDEGSMVNENLRKYIRQAADDFGVKFLFMGDPAQLPPVGEVKSPIWRIKVGSKLERIMRYDNQILELATRLREQVDRIAPAITLASNNDGEQGVWRFEGKAFEKQLLTAAELGEFSSPNRAKAIAWRNVTVDALNARIRARIFPEVTSPWVVGDRVIFTAPAKDLEDETIATTDDEGVVERVAEGWHPVYTEFKIFNITIVLDDNRSVMARVLHPDSLFAFNKKSNDLAVEARENPRKWRFFWAFKEAFHSLRHAYAITAHRSQGSTYDTAFVDWRDILLNQNRQEAYRCLYVACTRAKRALVLN